MWVVQDAVTRLRGRIGLFGFWEWRECIRAIGMEYHIVEIPGPQRAFITDDIVFIDHRLSSFHRAWYVWHELGHAFLHSGCALWWRGRPQGEITLAKFERQANEFAALFPVIDE